MNLNRVRHQLLVLVTAISFFLGGISTALAADTYGNYQNNQELNQAATLTAASSGPIEIYPQPDSKKSPLGKAQKGDRVIVIQQIEGNRGTQWDYVKFEQEDRGEGWIQQDYVAIQQQSSQSEQKPAQQSQSQSSPTYSQQEDYPNSQQSSKYKTQQKQTYSQTKQDQQKSQSYKGNQ